MKSIILSLLISAAVVSATPVTVKYINPGSPKVVDTDSKDYVGPYNLTVNGVATPAMCMDDFNLTSGSWSAAITPVTSDDLSNTYLGNTEFDYGFTSGNVYTLEAYLYNEITQPGADRIHIQDAAWAIMDIFTGHDPHGSDDPAVENIINDVVANGGSFDASGYEIISQVNPGDRPEQEFITATPATATPEPASFSLFGAGLLISAVGLIRRRKAVKA